MPLAPGTVIGEYYIPNPVGNPKWVKGYVPNPNGRPKNKPDGDKVLAARQEALVAMAEFVAKKQMKDACTILEEFANDESLKHYLRISAATALAPYQRGKKAVVPVPQYVTKAIVIPDFHGKIEEAETFLLDLSKRVASGELDFASVEQVSKRIQDWIYSVRAGEELAIKSLNAGTAQHDTTIRIEGGLPALPGTHITMPILNGHEVIDGTLLTSPGDASSDEPSVTPVTTDPSTAPIDPSPSDQSSMTTKDQST